MVIWRVLCRFKLFIWVHYMLTGRNLDTLFAMRLQDELSRVTHALYSSTRFATNVPFG